MTYKFNQHIHNYAVWTSARAVQRGFATTLIIKKAIEKSDLRNFSEDSFKYKSDDFDSFHRVCANQILNALKKTGLKKVRYGRAAKIIAIYLKTAIVICNKGKSSKSKIIHPPIDSILLNNISKKFSELKELKSIRWTQLNESKYWELVSKMRTFFGDFNWKLEEYWKPELER